MQPYEMRRVRRLAALAQGQKPDGLDCYFVEIAQQYRPYMHAIAFSILGNPDSAEDAVSEALLKAYINLHGFTPEERDSLKVKGWLAEIIRNLCFDDRNKDKEEESLELLLQTGFQVVAHPYSNPENWALYADAITIISKGLTALPPFDREIVKRFIMLDEPATKIAKSLGISSSTVYVRAYRAIRKLRHPAFSRLLLARDGQQSFGLILERA
jgi:RNA polymerase sigma factor (sigma-70 family)